MHMTKELTIDDLNFIIYSLEEAKKVFENYERYPDEGFRKESVKRVEGIIHKIKKIKTN